ncbi:MAG: hypothetical protein MJZ02_06660 [Paludibacteraceae bacterium]|nr:hypothetical protein [Paludibacteraceae bacterium]
MKKLFLILTMFSYAVCAFSFETDCKCDCHEIGGVRCSKCSSFHDDDECRCHCHKEMNAKHCSDCFYWHNDVAQYGVENAVELRKRKRQLSPSAHCQGKNTTRHPKNVVLQHIRLVGDAIRCGLHCCVPPN